jgi:hypothetical protein
MAEAKSWLGEDRASETSGSVNIPRAAVLAGCTIASQTMLNQHRVPGMIFLASIHLVSSNVTFGTQNMLERNDDLAYTGILILALAYDHEIRSPLEGTTLS